MPIKIKFKINIKYILIIILIAFIYSYFYLFRNTNLKLYLIKEINNRFSNNILYEHINTKIVYNSLNKIVNYEDILKSSEPETKDEPVVEEIKTEEIVIEEKPIIYIYNSHDTEKYSLEFSNVHSITPNVTHASMILKDHLNNLGIPTYVETKKTSEYIKKNDLPYAGGCYQGSREFIKEASKENDFKILIDIHRDSVSKKHTLYEKDGKKYARMMFVIGKGYDTYEKNEAVMKKLNSMLNEEYKGITRGIFVRKNSVFNQDLHERAILLELGGVDSTLEEINNSLYVFSQILDKYIKEELSGK